jgi:midasin
VLSQLHRGSGETSAPVFAFVEGALVSALRNGAWLLLDEINLAPNETLERLAGVLEVRFKYVKSAFA